MTVTEFQEALKRGLGSTVLALEEEKEIEQYKEAVLWSCLHNQVWDVQSEEGRGEYLYVVLSKFEEDEFFLDSISSAYQETGISYLLFEQLTEILYYFALDGNQMAVELMHQKYKILYQLIEQDALFEKRNLSKNRQNVWKSLQKDTTAVSYEGGNNEIQVKLDDQGCPNTDSLKNTEVLEESKQKIKKSGYFKMIDEGRADRIMQLDQEQKEKEKKLREDWVEQWECLCVRLTSLEGFRTYKRIMKDMGRLYLNGSSDIEFRWFHEYSAEKFGKKRINKYLKENAECTLAANAYYQEIKRIKKLQEENGKKERERLCKEISENRGEMKEDLEEQAGKNFIRPVIQVEKLIELCKRRPWTETRGFLVRLGRNGTEEELKKIALAAVMEEDLEIKAIMLWPFTLTPFCLDEKYMMEYVRSKNLRLRNTAFGMLERIQSDSVHDFAVTLIKEGLRRKKQTKADLAREQDFFWENALEKGISILCTNFRKEDSRLLSSAVHAVKVQEQDGSWHGAFGDVEKLINRNKNAPKELLLYLYRNTLCSFCREYIVRTMKKRGVLSEKIISECRNDSNSEIRNFVNKKFPQN